MVAKIIFGGKLFFVLPLHFPFCAPAPFFSLPLTSKRGKKNSIIIFREKQNSLSVKMSSNTIDDLLRNRDLVLIIVTFLTTNSKAALQLTSVNRDLYSLGSVPEFWDVVYRQALRATVRAKLSSPILMTPNGPTFEDRESQNAQSSSPTVEKRVSSAEEGSKADVDPTELLLKLYPLVPRVAPLGALCVRGVPWRKLVFLPTGRITNDMIIEAVQDVEAAGMVRALNLQYSDVTDRVVELILKSCPKLQELSLHHCNRLTVLTLSKLARQYPNVKATAFHHEAKSDDFIIQEMLEKHDAGKKRPQIRKGPSVFQASEIIDRKLWLGDVGDAYSVAEMAEKGIFCVVSVAEECPPAPAVKNNPQFSSKWVPLVDHSDTDISAHFQEVTTYIWDQIKSGKGVLVHCRHGVSRSATFIIAFLMRFGSLDSFDTDPPWTYEMALKYAKGRRNQISPNLGFVLALRDYEEELWKSTDGGNTRGEGEGGGSAKLASTRSRDGPTSFELALDWDSAAPS
jgi:hypothetical protein